MSQILTLPDGSTVTIPDAIFTLDASKPDPGHKLSPFKHTFNRTAKVYFRYCSWNN